MKKRIISVFTVLTLVFCVLSANFTVSAAKPTLAYNSQGADSLVYRGLTPFPEYHSSVELGYVSGINDQLSTGLCWTFTQNELIEAYVYKDTGKTVNFSEQTMKFDTSEDTNPKHGFVRTPNDGGNEYMSVAYLARRGATLESDEPFSVSEKRVVNPELLNYQGVVTSAPMLSFDESQKELAIWHAKNLITQYGAAGSGLYFVDSLKYQDNARSNYYFYETAGSPNHSVTIVGWDDNYPKEKFRVQPRGNGAFIVKNSWGNSHGNNTTDLVYVSYYDKFITNNFFATAFEMENDIYDNIYQYEYHGYTGSYNYSGDTPSLTYATKYRKTSGAQSISAVSTHVAAPGTKVEVFVNTANSEVTDDSKFRSVYTKTFEYPGYYLMEFSPLEITGDMFAVAIRVTAPSGNARFPVCENTGNYIRNAVQLQNTCYVTSGDFEDFRTLEDMGCTTRETMLVMKAFTVDTNSSTVDSTRVFKDVIKGKWYVEFVDFAVNHGIFDGTSKTTFEPLSSMTRAQFVQVLANITGVDTGMSDVNSGFTDVPKGKWYTAAVTWASAEGIVSGVGDKKFDPNALITREQMCVMLVNYSEKYLGMKLTMSKERFADHADISYWAEKEVYKCKNAGLISGVGDNKFAPLDTANRAMGATVFTNYYKKYFFS